MRFSCIPLATLLAAGACTTEIVEPASGSIDAYIASLPYLPVDNAQVDQGAKSAEDREGDYSCTTQNLKETRQYDRIVAYAANSDSFYPGP